MWMMGYNDGGDINMPDSCDSWRLNPLFPRTLPSVNITSTSTTPRLPGSDLFALNHHVATIADQGKREFNTQPSRWNPTPEQLRTLEELYRLGTRTPTAEQIQNITAQLRRYGKIEGKNVFYWFQNHKARERQKRRRQMESASEHEQTRDMEILERKESEVMTGYEGEQTKNWIPSTNCSTRSQESVSIPTTASKTAMAKCRTDGWIHFDEGDLQLGKNIIERNATWEMIQSSCPHHTQLINTSPSAAAAATTSSQAMATTPTSAALIRKMEAKVIKAYELSISMAPFVENEHGLIKHFGNTSVVNEENWCGGSQTLQLFPLRSGGDGEQSTSEEETEISVNSAITANLAPCQFFEFLPLKN